MAQTFSMRYPLIKGQVTLVRLTAIRGSHALHRGQADKIAEELLLILKKKPWTLSTTLMPLLKNLPTCRPNT
jgi:hypothetical protein